MIGKEISEKERISKIVDEMIDILKVSVGREGGHLPFYKAGDKCEMKDLLFYKLCKEAACDRH